MVLTLTSKQKGLINMTPFQDTLIRIILCIIFPPLAVFDKGCGTMILVFLLTLLGWLPGTIAALLICLNANYSGNA